MCMAAIHRTGTESVWNRAQNILDKPVQDLYILYHMHTLCPTESLEFLGVKTPLLCGAVGHLDDDRRRVRRK